MTNISGLYIDNSASPERLDQAKSWTVKAMEVAEQARTDIGNPSAKKNWIKKSDATLLEQEKVECERVWAVLLYNLGSILEVSRLFCIFVGFRSPPYGVCCPPAPQ